MKQLFYKRLIYYLLISDFFNVISPYFVVIIWTATNIRFVSYNHVIPVLLVFHFSAVYIQVIDPLASSPY